MYGCGVGFARSNSNISKCVNYGNVKSSEKCIGVGGIAGTINEESKIEECINKGSVEGKQNLGGIVGAIAGESIINKCGNEGKITFSIDYPWTIGGILGWSEGGEINSCYNISDIRNGNQVGGIIGGVKADYSTCIMNCYNTANIEGINYVGGIIGSSNTIDTTSLKISNCYNTGKISTKATTNNAYNGPIFGNLNHGEQKNLNNGEETNTVIENTYYLKSAVSSNAIGLEYSGLSSIENSDDMKTTEFLSKLENEYVADARKINNSYPILKWQK